MSLVFKILTIAAVIFYGVCNLVMAYRRDASEMYGEIIEGQCVVGKICANIFYIPAWFLKGLRATVLYLVK